MEYDIGANGSGTICQLSADLTFNDHEAFRSMLDDAVAQASGEIVLDLSKLEFIDSAGMGMLLVAQERSQSEGWSLVIDKPQGQVQKMLELAKLGQVVTIRS